MQHHSMPTIVSTVCLVAILLTSTDTNAQSPYQNLLDPRMGQQKLRFDIEGELTDRQDVFGQADTMRMDRQTIRFFIPLQQDERREYAIFGDVTHLSIGSDALLFNGLQGFLFGSPEIPNSLWDVGVGFFHRYKLDNDWTFGGAIRIGSASDQPFDSFDEITITGNWMLRMPVDDNDAWIVLINFMNNREFLPGIPIPGFGYQFSREWGDEHILSGMVGLPFNQIRWRPIQPLLFSLDYFLLRNLKAEVRYTITDPLDIYAGFALFNERYLRAGRDNDDDRLFYYEKRLFTGITWRIDDNVSLDVGGGWAFDRSFFEAEDFDDDDRNDVGIADGPYGQVRLTFQF